MHVDTGFDFNKKIYKQTLIPLSNEGETVIFKIDFMAAQQLFQLTLRNWQQRVIIKDHLNILSLYGNNDFDKITHMKNI